MFREHSCRLGDVMRDGNALRASALSEFLKFRRKRGDLAGRDMRCHEIRCSGGVETVTHPFGVRETVICESGIIAVKCHAQRVEACRPGRIPILIAGKLHRQFHMRQRIGRRI